MGMKPRTSRALHPKVKEARRVIRKARRVALIVETAETVEEAAVAHVVDRFAEEMLSKLLDNMHKGGWDNERLGWLMSRLDEELWEAKQALSAFTAVRGVQPNETSLILHHKVNAQRELADVANFCMMLFARLDKLAPDEY